MEAGFVLWSHALAALLFGLLAAWAWRAGDVAVPRRPLVAALGLMALWALAVAGLGASELVTRLAETLRNLSWLGFMLMLQRRDAQSAPPLALGTVFGVVALVAIGAFAVQGYADQAPGPAGEAAGFVALLLRMLTAVGALVLVQALGATLSPATGSGLRWLIGALAGLWLVDFLLFGLAYLDAGRPVLALAVRGGATLAIGLIFAVALRRGGRWSVQVSRTVTYQSLSLVAIGAYFALLALAMSALATVGGENARMLQTAFVLGSTMAILTLVSNSWLRGWIKVKLSKHLFRHRYDYRAEWMRFTETLGAPEGAMPLDARLVKAIADLVGSPAGLLLVPHERALVAGASWNWEGRDIESVGDLPLHEDLFADHRIIELDALRRGDIDASPASAPMPDWMLDRADAWAVVPLPHLGRLAGAILLARPPFDRPLDWEDFDLLKAAGRQVGSYLAEARAQEALAEAQRFDEFNRRFAFILHDIKNLVSQLTLTARNAERHADNPAFRADMVATLRESAERMNMLLARLSQHHRGRAEPPHAIDVVPLVARLAAARGAQHPLRVEGAETAIARADRVGLEQLLAHLVQNAIEASPAGAPVTLSVAVETDEVTIEVADRGSGMSPGFIRDKLFKPFTSTKNGGFGLGAFEARQLAAAMDGRIEVVSREGEGSRFRILLKAAQPASAAVDRAA